MTNQPRKVYLATSGEYSDYRVRHVFAREEDARAYPLADDVDEREVHDGPVEVRYWHMLRWRAWLPDRPGSFSESPNPDEDRELLDFDGRAGDAEHHWDTGHAGPGHAMLTVRGWDLERVRKVYSEQRAKHLAQQAGL